MKKITRLAAILMSSALAFTLWSCDNPAASNDSGDLKTTDSSELARPLTIEVASDTQIYVKNPWSTLKYKKNGGEAVQIIATEPEFSGNGMMALIDVKSGDKIEFYADGSENKTASYPLTIYCSYGTECYVYGNVMSLLDSENFATLKEITEERAFEMLFETSKLLSHADKKLLLPATTLSKACYKGMFYGSSITKAPELPATTLTESCYEYMFSSCSSLTQAPELPAPLLVKNCYNNMFYYCSNLEYVKCLASDISAEGSTDNWLKTVSSTGTFVKANGVKWSRDGSGIPNGWTEEPLIPEYRITCSDSLITLSKSSAMAGETVTVSVANVILLSLYDFNVIKNSSKEEIALSGSDETRTFIMPAEEVTVRAAYKVSVYNNIKNGTMKISIGSEEVTYAYPGDIITVTAEADSGFRLKSFSLIYVGAGMGSLPFNQNGNTCTFTMTNGGVSVSGSFEEDIIGTKKRPDTVGDIVFNDGTALPASEYNNRALTDKEKQNAIAVVAYVYKINGNPDSCITVGLKQEYTELCTSDSEGNTKTDNFSNVVNNQDNKSSMDVRDKICNGDGSITDYSEEKYPAFYWAQHYTGYNNLGNITYDWLIPNLTDIANIYEEKEVVENAISKIGSDYAMPFINNNKSKYVTVTQYPDDANAGDKVYLFDLSDGSKVGNYKSSKSPVLVIRKFMCHD